MRSQLLNIILKSFIVFTLIALTNSCESDLDQLKDNGIEISGTIPDAYYTKFNITYSDSGLLKVKITGLILEQFAKTKESPGIDIMKDSVHICFYNSDKQVTSELFADHAVRNHKTEEMVATGNVLVINSIGEHLNTERLTWNSQTKKIICDTTVVVTKPGGQKIKAKGLISDEKFENYSFKEVSGELKFKREEAPK